MEWVNYAKDAWGQKMLVGVSWDLLWIPFAAAGAVIILHLLMRRLRGVQAQ